jgi:hypothetical protein
MQSYIDHNVSATRDEQAWALLKKKAKALSLK